MLQKNLRDGFPRTDWTKRIRLVDTLALNLYTDFMSTARQFERISVEDYLDGERLAEGKHEYVLGMVYAQAGGSNAHNLIASNALVALAKLLPGKPCRVYNSDTKIRVRESTGTRFYYPDTMVVCRSNPPQESFQDEPVVVVEVISESTRRIDEGEKRDSYLSIPSLDTYILLEQTTATAVVYQRIPNGFEQMVFVGLEAQIPLPELKGSLLLSEIYETVDIGNIDTEG